MLLEWNNYGIVQVGTAGIVLKASPGRLGQMVCYNTSGAVVYIQLHNKATAPVNGEVAIADNPIDPSSRDMIDTFGLGGVGIYCSAGVSIAVSSTPRVLTLLGANSGNVWAQWL